MESRIAPIKSTSQRAEPAAVARAAAAPDQTLRQTGSREFVRMALAAVASGVVFGIVSGLVVWLIASYQHLDSADALAHAPEAVERTAR